MAAITSTLVSYPPRERLSEQSFFPLVGLAQNPVGTRLPGAVEGIVKLKPPEQEVAVACRSLFSFP